MKLNKIFTSNAVFAKGKPIRIYGDGAGVASISFAGDTKTVESTFDEWSVEFDPMDYGGPYTLEAIFEDETVTLENIYIGIVLLISGQSNMQFKMKESSQKGGKYIENRKIRCFFTERIENGEKYTPDDGWVECTAETAPDWSAIGYNLAHNFARAQDVAVGLIACYQGASVIQSWYPKGSNEAAGIFIDHSEKHSDHTHPIYVKWNPEGVLYEFALSQVIPFAVSAVVWYQGESNAAEGEAVYYKDELHVLVNRWRADFCDEKLPFVVVQISNYIKRADVGWYMIQKAQKDFEAEKELVKCVISSDICEDDNIHPPTKDKLAERIYQALVEMI